MLTFKAETMDEAKARYRAAAASLASLMGERVGADRRHVFDFGDGLRLMVSRDDLGPVIGVRIHVSASFTTDSPIGIGLVATWRRDGRAAAESALRGEAEARFRELSGGESPLKFVFFSPGKGVPHWYVDGS